MTVVEKCRSEAGHMWYVVRIDLTFYPTFWSRFTRFRPKARIREQAWHKLEVTEGFRGRECRWHEKYVSLQMQRGGPDVRQWLRDNLTGRAIIHIRMENSTDPMFFSDWHVQKEFYGMFANDADAVKFKLALL